MKLVVALFAINTQATQYLSVASRLALVSDAVKAAQRYTEGLGTAFWKDMSAMRAIVLAPEYCFARSLPNLKGDHGFGDKRQMEEDYVKNKLRPVFGQLSGGFKNSLIVPGTVAWRKSIMPATGDGNRTAQEIADHRRDKYTQRLEDSVNTNMFYWPKKDLPHNYPFTEKSTPFPTAFKRGDDTRPGIPTVEDKIQMLATTAHYIAKNTAHCYYNGDDIYNYNKIGDFYEVPEAQTDTVIVPNRGTVSGATTGAGRFKVGDLDFGISVCYDQSLVVQDTTKNVNPLEPLQKTAGAVDFHILLSAHISPNKDQANLKSGGYLLSCSSSKDCNKVIHATQGEIQRDDKEKIGGAHNLYLYQLEL